ncbi:MAG TPA: DUF3106 domain-containing protein, partial [Acidobacteriaceae bacterium]|nr:DUF3106 domain-containing protein [Acidobacteriaceae bacterium]
MISGRQDKTRGTTPGRGVAFGWVAWLAVLCLVWVSVPAHARGLGQGQHGQRSQSARPAPRQPERRAAEPSRGSDAGRAAGNPGEARPDGNRPGAGSEERLSPAVNRMEMRPAGNGGQGTYGDRDRPGHLGQWLMNHQNLSPQQREEQLRREPGFNRLSPDQQQRVLNRLRSLDARPPEQRQRMIRRNEMFEQLNPEQKQGVRQSFQAWNQMTPDRHRMLGRAFADLRQIPPDQRSAILNSARFSHEFSPDERRVLGNLLSIEPYEPR